MLFVRGLLFFLSKERKVEDELVSTTYQFYILATEPQYSYSTTLYSLLSTLYALPSTLYSLPSTLYPLLSTLYSLPSTLYPLLSTLYSLPSTFYPLLSTLYSLLSTLYSLLSTLYSLLFTLYSSGNDISRTSHPSTYCPFPPSLNLPDPPISGTVLGLLLHP